MKGDVKAVRVTATGAVFAGRTRLRGIILENDGLCYTINNFARQHKTAQLYLQQVVLQVMFLHLTFQKMEFYFQVE